MELFKKPSYISGGNFPSSNNTRTCSEKISYTTFLPFLYYFLLSCLKSSYIFSEEKKNSCISGENLQSLKKISYTLGNETFFYFLTRE